MIILMSLCETFAAALSSVSLSRPKEAVPRHPCTCDANLETEEWQTWEADWCSLSLLQARGFVAHSDLQLIRWGIRLISSYHVRTAHQLQWWKQCHRFCDIKFKLYIIRFDGCLSFQKQIRTGNRAKCGCNLYMYWICSECTLYNDGTQ